MKSQTVLSSIDEVVARRGHEIALVDQTGAWSYHELAQQGHLIRTVGGAQSFHS